jgi:predicted metal-binding protein
MDIDKIESVMRDNGYEDFRWISGKDVVVSQWPRFKCMFGCPSYGEKGSCPPSVPSIQDCREYFSEYDKIAVIHLKKKLDDPDDRKEWSRKTNLNLLKLEKAVFLLGNEKAFLLFMDECRICKDCYGTRIDCKNPHLSRPCPEALGVDVFTTVSKIGFPIKVLGDYEQEMNRYSFLMVE